MYVHVSTSIASTSNPAALILSMANLSIANLSTANLFTLERPNLIKKRLIT